MPMDELLQWVSLTSQLKCLKSLFSKNIQHSLLKVPILAVSKQGCLLSKWLIYRSSTYGCLGPAEQVSQKTVKNTPILGTEKTREQSWKSDPSQQESKAFFQGGLCPSSALALSCPPPCPPPSHHLPVIVSGASNLHPISSLCSCFPHTQHALHKTPGLFLNLVNPPR